MPGIEDWKVRPLATIQSIYEENEGCSHEDFVTKIEEYFMQVVDADTSSRIPSLNSIPLDQLCSGSLVKYRCMVQDVFDPQFCFRQYRVENSKTRTSRIAFGLFQDITNLAPDETVDFDSKDSMAVERQGFYCVPIPGESDWVKKAYSKCDDAGKVISLPGATSRPKREREEDDPSDSETCQKSLKDGETISVDSEMRENNIPPPAESCSSATGQMCSPAKILNLNMPLPDEKGKPCIVRVYSRNVELKATDAIEVVGILSLDPQLASTDDFQIDESERDELQAHEPPPSLVPRLHALVTRHLHHNNPGLGPNPSSENYKRDVARLMEDACSLHLELLSVIEHALLGDKLAAEYLLCNLVSSVYARADGLPLGKLCVNISQCPVTQKYAALLHHLISQLVTQSVVIDMSIDNMNTLQLVPSKDYTLNRLTAGMLQLTAGTHLVLNETALHQGQLNQAGVLNVKALAEVITWQKVEYDYRWHPVPIPTDFPVLTLSEGESLLPKDVHVPLSANGEVVDMAEHFSKLDGRLTEESLNKMRSYITACRLSEYSVTEELQTVMQEDFVEQRQINPKDMSVDDFHRMLGLVRALTLTFGQSSPSIELWVKAKAMETARKARVANLPQAHRS